MDGGRRHVNERAAVVERLDLNTWQEAAGSFIQLLDFGAHIFKRRKRLLPFAHQDDPLHPVIVILPGSLAILVEKVFAIFFLLWQADAELSLPSPIGNRDSFLS